MDIATIAGIAAGFLLLFISIIFGGSLGMFINIPSLCVVIGGTVCALLIAYPMSDFLKVMKVVKNAFTSKEKDPTELIVEFIKLNLFVKQNGPINLVPQAKKLDDPFILKGAQMIADQLPADNIESVLGLELNAILTRHRLGQEIMQDSGTYAPAFGMIGTLIGLVQMLAALDDPKTIGPKMAVALITTFYGAVVANLLCLPIKKKLKVRSDQEKVYKQLCIVGTLAIRNNESPMILEDKMKSTLSKAEQQKVEKKKSKMK